MLESRKALKVISSLVIGLSLVGVGSGVVQATSFTAPKLGAAEVVPTDPSIKKGDKIFVVVKDTKNQKVAVYNQDAKKTGAKVTMAQLTPLRQLRKLTAKRLLRSTRVNG